MEKTSSTLLANWKMHLALSPGWNALATILAYSNLRLAGSSHSPASASQVAGITETGFHHVGQALLELLTSSDPLALASKSAGITGMSHCTQSATTAGQEFDPLTLKFRLSHSSTASNGKLCPGSSSPYGEAQFRGVSLGNEPHRGGTTERIEEEPGKQSPREILIENRGSCGVNASALGWKKDPATFIPKSYQFRDVTRMTE
ncbi:hypothetical protein AAY473_007079 [Plecturocebus cupreus]